MIALYEYRAERRKAEAFRLQVDAEEGWQHKVLRRIRRAKLPALMTPVRAEPLIAPWSEKTDGNALSWSLDDIISEMKRG